MARHRVCLRRDNIPLHTRRWGFKITFDEHTISNVAISLHFERLAIYREISLNQIGSISLRRSLTKIEQLKLYKDIKPYDDIFVVQSLKFIIKDCTIQTTLLSGNDIVPWFELDTIDEISLSSYNLIRLSGISDISLLSADDNLEVDLRESLLSAKPKRIYEIKPKVYELGSRRFPRSSYFRNVNNRFAFLSGGFHLKISVEIDFRKPNLD